MIKKFEQFLEIFTPKVVDRFKRVEDLALLLIPDMPAFDVVDGDYVTRITNYDMSTDSLEDIWIMLFDVTNIEIYYDYDKKIVKDFKFEDPKYSFKSIQDLETFLNYMTKYVFFSEYNRVVSENEIENTKEARLKVIQDANELYVHLKEFALKAALVHSA
jgi:hypothetical protein